VHEGIGDPPHCDKPPVCPFKPVEKLEFFRAHTKIQLQSGLYSIFGLLKFEIEELF
jgi:hypothetical protein